MAGVSKALSEDAAEEGLCGGGNEKGQGGCSRCSSTSATRGVRRGERPACEGPSLVRERPSGRSIQFRTSRGVIGPFASSSPSPVPGPTEIFVGTFERPSVW